VNLIVCAFSDSFLAIFITPILVKTIYKYKTKVRKVTFYVYNLSLIS